MRSKDQLANIHTNALTKQIFDGFRSKLGIIVLPLTSLWGSVEGKDQAEDKDRVDQHGTTVKSLVGC